MLPQLGPGPKYKLDSLLGYDNHDVTKTRYPSYSIGPKLDAARPVPTPGPKYAFDKIYRTGRESSPAWVHLSKPKELRHQIIPGANRYQPFSNEYISVKKPPEFSLLGKCPRTLRTCGPAPNKYVLPTTVAAPIPDKKTAPAFSQAGKWHEPKRYMQSPGPMRYATVNLDLYKPKSPEYTILGKTPFSTRVERTKPGPKYMWKFNERDEGYVAPGPSLGIRHSPYKLRVLTELDRQDFMPL